MGSGQWSKNAGAGPASGLCSCRRLDRLFDGGAQTGLLVCSGIAVQHTNFDSLIDLAEGSTHAGLHGGLGVLPWGLTVGSHGCEAALHQGAQGRFVGAVAKAIALANLNTLFRGLVIGHRRTVDRSAVENPTFRPPHAPNQAKGSGVAT